MKIFRDKTIQLMHCFKRFFLKLSSDIRGMSGVMLTMSIIPTIGVIGIATDVSRTYIVKTRLSTALDAAALAGGRNFFEADREAQIKKYFDANFPANFMGSEVTGPFELDAEGNQLPEGHIYNADDEVLRLTANVSVPTVFMNVFNFDNMTAGGDSEVTRETSLLDVVIAIDMSGSMNLNISGTSVPTMPYRRIGLAKAAATDLVDILYGNNEVNALLNIGLVPWSGKVNVTTNGTEYGFDGAGAPLPANLRFTTQPVIGSPDNPYREEFYRFDKFDDEDIWDDDEDLVLKNWTPQIDNVYFAHNAPSVPLLAEPPTDWRGCVYARFARTRPYDDYQSYKDDQAEADAGDIVDGPFESIDGPAWVGWYPMGEEGEVRKCDLRSLNNTSANCTTCPTYGITPLQNSKIVMKDAIEELLIPSGSFYTNIPQGLAWAWRVITPGEPFDEATVVESETYVKHKAIILLTDGTNTVRNADAYNNGFHSRSRRDNRLRDLADAIKNKNDENFDNDDEILIYTIQFANSNASLVDLLKYVATDDDYYYHAPDKASLQNAFKKIAKELSNLRLSK
ncbi:MAG: VWA domain-containing protein [Emcibacter sp.]|nr:VWA domain-containing protein [Emcibacter sp.]